MLVEQRVDVGHDHHEDIVEVMRDAAGQLADGLHFLRLSQLVFGGATCLVGIHLFGHIVSSRQQGSSTIQLDLTLGHLDVDDRAVLLAQMKTPTPTQLSCIQKPRNERCHDRQEFIV